MTYDNALTALADPTRQKIVEQLRAGPKTVGALGKHLPVSRPAVSQHVKVLSDAGLLDVSVEGTRRFYRLSPQGIAAVRNYLDQLWGDALSAFEAYAIKMKDDLHMLDPVEKNVTVSNPDAVFCCFIAHEGAICHYVFL